jgi:hypothetical protein
VLRLEGHWKEIGRRLVGTMKEGRRPVVALIESAIVATGLQFALSTIATPTNSHMQEM